MNESQVADTVRALLDCIGTAGGAQTVACAPIETPAGVTVIPISKISVGFASGSLGGNSKLFADRKGAGGGTGITLTPVAFLTVSKAGATDLFPVNERSTNAAESAEIFSFLMENAPAVIRKLKELFS